ncbi:MAG TPA: ferredoxin [Pseudonocardiaceae bacterium]|nr:ferredoxin [Pseudonocardiaceae bacterium]
MMRIIVDREVCVGAGQCVLTAAELFDQSESDGRVVVVRQPQVADLAAVRDAVGVCPAGAISLVD